MFLFLVLCIFTPLKSAPVDLGQDASTACPHEYLESVGFNDSVATRYLPIGEGETVSSSLGEYRTHLYYYENFNVTMMNLPEETRKLIIMLEPCQGSVFLLVRKTRPCWPNPYSCFDINTGERQDSCEWTHFSSVIDGSRDGAPTFYEVPLTSTRWFITVFSIEKRAQYSLTVLSDIGAMPRPGGRGSISGTQMGELKVQLDWKQAYFMPVGVSQVRRYWVFSSMLLDQDIRTNTQVFLRPSKVMNTVCGLQKNTDREYHIVDPSTCSSSSGMCSVNITGVMTQKRYIFNVIVESERGFFRAYSGLIMETNWNVYTKAASDQTLQVVATVSGTVLGLVTVGYLWLLRIYT